MQPKHTRYRCFRSMKLQLRKGKSPGDDRQRIYSGGLSLGIDVRLRNGESDALDTRPLRPDGISRTSSWKCRAP